MADLLCDALRQTMMRLSAQEMARIQHDPTQAEAIQELRDLFALLNGPDALIIAVQKVPTRGCDNPYCRKAYIGAGRYCSTRCAELMQ